MKKSVNDCIGYIGQIPKNHDFRKLEKSALSKIEILVEISMFFNDMVNRPTSGGLKPIFDTEFFKARSMLPVSEFFIQFQSDFFKHRLKL